MAALSHLAAGFPRLGPLPELRPWRAKQTRPRASIA